MILAADFLREKKGRLWRLNDWGFRRLAYKIKKAKNAHYILMNFELEARWINDFKTVLDKDESHSASVITRDEAITEDCPPPPEWHTLHAGGDDYDDAYEVEDDEDLGEDWDGEDDVDIFENGLIAGDDDYIEGKSANVGNTGRRNLKAEKVAG